jgi:hypothetical protein
MPIVQFTGEHPSVRMYYSLAEATERAHAYPDDLFYDATSRALTRRGSAAEPLQALAAPTDAELRDPLIAELRRMADAGLVGEAGDAEEVAATISWLECAPTTQYMLYALFPGPSDNGSDDEPDAFRSACKRGCSVFEKIWNRHCC